MIQLLGCWWEKWTIGCKLSTWVGSNVPIHILWLTFVTWSLLCGRSLSFLSPQVIHQSTSAMVLICALTYSCLPGNFRPLGVPLPTKVIWRSGRQLRTQTPDITAQIEVEEITPTAEFKLQALVWSCLPRNLKRLQLQQCALTDTHITTLTRALSQHLAIQVGLLTKMDALVSILPGFLPTMLSSFVIKLDLFTHSSPSRIAWLRVHISPKQHGCRSSRWMHRLRNRQSSFNPL